MSGKGTAARPKYRFCWSCSRQLHGDFHRVAIVDGNEVVVRADCARRDKPDAHLAAEGRARKGGGA